MTKLRFTDGVTIDTSGKLRKLRLHDGLYVVGQGTCIPVNNEDEAEQIISSLIKTKGNEKDTE